jgi:hypothetical protein
MKKAIVALVVLTILGVAALICSTCCKPSDEEQAFSAIQRAFDAVLKHKQTTGEWPTSLSELADTKVMFHDGAQMLYDPTNLKFTVPVEYDKSSPIYNLTFGLIDVKRTGGPYSMEFLGWLKSQDAEQPTAQLQSEGAPSA